MLRLIKAELTKLRKRNSTWILLSILIAVLLLVIVIIQSEISSGGEAGALIANVSLLNIVVPLALGVISSLGTILAIILLTNSVGSEYGWHTIRTFVLCSESRLKMLTAKVIASLIAIVSGMVVAILVAILAGVVFTASRGLSWDLTFINGHYVFDQLSNFFRTLYVILPYISLGMLFSVLGRSTAAGMGFGLGIYFTEPLVIALLRGTFGWTSKIPDYLFSANTQVIMSAVQSPFNIRIGPVDAHVPAVAWAVIVLAIYFVIFTAISFYLFKKRDITA